MLRYASHFFVANVRKTRSPYVPLLNDGFPQQLAKVSKLRPETKLELLPDITQHAYNTRRLHSHTRHRRNAAFTRGVPVSTEQTRREGRCFARLSSFGELKGNRGPVIPTTSDGAS